MTLRNVYILLSQRVGAGLAIALFFCAPTLAQKNDVETNKILSANNNKKISLTLITKEANIVFPDILKGNEAQSIDYIENFSVKRRDYLIRMFTKGKKWLPKAAAILKKHQLPEELKVLLTLESAYNGNVVSTAGAVGYWQIMDAVAKEYGLQYTTQLTPAEKAKIVKEKGSKADSIFKAVEKVKDDRKNFQKSSLAAAKYLNDRKVNLHGNWLLVVASYNCGVGNVWNAIKKTGNSNASFWDIKQFLPAETQAYVMNFITLNVIFKNYNAFTNNKLTYKPTQIMVPDNFEQTVNASLEENTINKK
jgi:membrane-bound lytic murein transglycosylase D